MGQAKVKGAWRGVRGPVFPRASLLAVVTQGLIPAFSKKAGGKEVGDERECKVAEKIGNECECKKGGNALNPSNLTVVYFALSVAVISDAFFYFVLSGVEPFALK